MWLHNTRRSDPPPKSVWWCNCKYTIVTLRKAYACEQMINGRKKCTKVVGHSWNKVQIHSKSITIGMHTIQFLYHKTLLLLLNIVPTKLECQTIIYILSQCKDRQMLMIFTVCPIAIGLKDTLFKFDSKLGFVKVHIVILSLVATIVF